MLVVPLPALSVRQLEPVFEEEVLEWERQLYWDYHPPLELLKRYIREGALPGFVLLDGEGKAVGYSYYVSDGKVGYIGNLFVVKAVAERAAYSLLLDATLTALQTSTLVKRIECQVFPFYFDFSELFRSRSFQTLKRLYLSLELVRLASLPPPLSPSASQFTIRPWSPEFVEDAARIVYESYLKSVDQRLCFDYQSLEGCQRFIRNLLRNPGCGRFCPETSSLAFDCDNRLCGVLLTSQISPNTGMIPQISVRPDCQGQGLGRTMLFRYLKAAAESGLERVSLSVSEANHHARRLYESLGFKLVKEFYAFVWEQIPPSKSTGTSRAGALSDSKSD